MYVTLEDSLYDYVECRCTDSLNCYLEVDNSALVSYDGVIYRGFTMLVDSLYVGYELVQNDYVMSWSKELKTAVAFSKYNKELLRFDDVALDNLGIQLEDVTKLVIPTVFVCKHPISVLDVNENIDTNQLVEVTNDESELISWCNSYFVVDEIHYVDEDNYRGYMVEVTQYKR